ncbi:unnamed protein product [Caenorhabditis auriculariae]|uniref:Saposin B-type domain-containing protein n=1 Tax=Caenorhabditis auriculariae TaxID=2777116 RepID=A0A8S1GRH6_9PELO|nr:unnamed protein product [Caenorhabditis auriculariae]
MKLLFVSAVCFAIAFSAPQPKKRDDQCGAVDLKVSKKYVPFQADITCEICLDLVLIAETYAECEEAVIEHHLDAYCDEKVHSKPADAACRAMVNQIAHEVITDTEQNATTICHKVIHKTCTYTIV